MTKAYHLSMFGFLLSCLYLAYIAVARNLSNVIVEHHPHPPQGMELRDLSQQQHSPDHSMKTTTTTTTSLSTKVERGKLVSAQVTAEELYEAYQSIRNEYDEKAFMCDHEDHSHSLYVSKNSNRKSTKKQNDKCQGKWKTLKQTEDGIEVSILQHPSDPTCPYVRMTAVMPGSMEDVWNFLMLDNWDKTMPKMDPFYEGLEISKRYFFHTKKKNNNKHKKPIEMILARKKTNRLLTFGKRDFTFVQVSDTPRDDGVWVSGTVSVVTDKLPRKKGYTRAFQDSIAFYEPLPPGNNGMEPRTRITIVCRIDLNDSAQDGDGGSIPMWIYVKTIGSTGVLSIKNMMKELQKDLDERKEQQLLEDTVIQGDDSIEKKEKKFVFLPWFSKATPIAAKDVDIHENNNDPTSLPPKGKMPNFFSSIFLPKQ